MSRITSRSAWGARPPRSTDAVPWSARTGFCIHHSAGPADQSIQVIQNFHMDSRGWADIGYNFLVRSDGRIYEGRGWNRLGAHASGHNTANIGVCVIGDYTRTEPSAAVKSALAWLYREAERRKGRSLTVRTHRQVGSTACPGDRLHTWATGQLAGHDPGQAPAPSRPGRAVRPAPGPEIPYPLPAGHYFGPKNGGNASVSGFFGRSFKGRQDSAWLQEWTRQLERRGWDARKGGDYLTRYGNDGKYGSEYAELIKAFQADQGLAVDGLLGPQTWRAAYRNPVTA